MSTARYFKLADVKDHLPVARWRVTGDLVETRHSKGYPWRRSVTQVDEFIKPDGTAQDDVIELQEGEA